MSRDYDYDRDYEDYRGGKRRPTGQKRRRWQRQPDPGLAAGVYRVGWSTGAPTTVQEYPGGGKRLRQIQHREVVAVSHSRGAMAKLRDEPGWFLYKHPHFGRGIEGPLAQFENPKAPQLFAAAKMGNVDGVSRLIRRDRSIVHAKDIREDKSGLHYALQKRRLEVTKLLLSARSNPNELTKLSVAPLHIAAEVGFANGIKALIQYNAFIDARNSSTQEIHDGNYQRIFKDGSTEQLAGAGEHNTPLHIAIEKSAVECVRVLLQNKANTEIRNANDLTALHTAVEAEDEACVKLLLQARANTESTCPDLGNKTALNYSVSQGLHGISEMLIKANASVNFVGKRGMTPMHLAARRGDTRIVAMLMAAKADPNAKDKSGNMPAFYATKNKRLEVMQLLLQKA